MNDMLFGTIRTMISGTNRTAKAPKTGVLIAISVVLALLSLFFATHARRQAPHRILPILLPHPM